VDEIMDSLEQLGSIIPGGRPVRRVEEGIYSLLSDVGEGARYDRKAALYDRVVGSDIYNRLLWGTSPAVYRAFARAAMEERNDGLFLDAGCGSMLFTAELYRAHRRPVIAVDRSLGMLRRARARLAGRDGRVPESVLLLQGDLFDLPFAPGSFATVFCMGMLHLFEEVGPLVSSLRGLLDDRGRLHLTSIVANRRRGDYYLSAIHRAGEVATPRSGAALQRMLGEGCAPGELSYAIEGNMAYATLG
jgi:SAM-dependent methyltransferase